MRLLIFCSLIFCTCSLAAPLKDGEAEVRLLAERIPRGLGKIVLANEEVASDPFDLPMNNLSRPQKAPGRLFNVFEVDEEIAIARVQLPEEGDSFVVLLLPNSKGRYTSLVIPFENPNFKGGDIYFHNNSNKPVLGLLGRTKMSLKPGEGTVVTPRWDGDKPYYHATLGVREEGGDRVIKSMKWPSSKNIRNYVFFYMDPVKDRVTYRAVDEFILPKKKPEES